MTDFKFECLEHGIQNVKEIDYNRSYNMFPFVIFKETLILECGCIYCSYENGYKLIEINKGRIK